MTIPDITIVSEAIKASWDKTTSIDPRWTEDNPALGQCAITALVVQDEYGGTLLRAVVDGVSHYWNQLADGSEVDLTRQQFATFDPQGIVEREREYVLDFPDTAERYRILRRRVVRWLERGNEEGGQSA